MTNNQTIAGTIMDQLGNGNGRGFWHMIGGKDIVAIDNGVQFGFPKAEQGINKVVITLNGHDTYDLKFWRITNRSCKEIVGVGDIYNDQLGDIFENITGLATHL